MKLIVITSPHPVPYEAQRIRELFDCGIDILHLRKPGASAADCARLLDTLPGECLRRIVVHDHFQLCRDYGLGGIHLNRRNPTVPPFIAAARCGKTSACGCQTIGRSDQSHAQGGETRPATIPTVSASCHSIAETAAKKADADYVFLSPIFDSISKQGYQAAYSDGALSKAAADGIIDSRVIALGGITADRMPMLRRWHFGGAAFLGDVWNRAGQDDFCSHVRLLAEMR